MYSNDKKWLLFKNYGMENQEFCCDYDTFERAKEAKKEAERDGEDHQILLNKNDNPTTEY